jgi:hypothetical protein
MPSRAIPPPDDEQYEAHAPHAVELRLAFWDSDVHSAFLTEPKFSVDNIKTQRWQDTVFPALPEEDAFLLQVIHAFNHVLTGGVRMAWLYEIGYFLSQRSTDELLWQRVERRIEENALLRKIVIVVKRTFSRHPSRRRLLLGHRSLIPQFEFGLKTMRGRGCSRKIEWTNSGFSRRPKSSSFFISSIFLTQALGGA